MTHTFFKRSPGLFSQTKPTGLRQSSDLYGQDAPVPFSWGRQEGCAHRIRRANQGHSSQCGLWFPLPIGWHGRLFNYFFNSVSPWCWRTQPTVHWITNILRLHMMANTRKRNLWAQIQHTIVLIYSFIYLLQQLNAAYMVDVTSLVLLPRWM